MLRFTPKIPLKYDAMAVGEVHVWKLDLDVLFSKSDMSKVSIKECKKINRLHDSKHQVRALAMKVQLRELLSRYLSIKPSEIEFGLAEFGKPYLKNSPLSFNVSHSGDRALVAISLCEKMGVDIENWRVIDNLQGLVERNFSVEEKNQWLDIDDNKRMPIFFDIWVCKEAFIKATGRGLGMGVTNCAFDLLKPNKLLNCPPEYGPSSDWVCVYLPVWEKASAALIMNTTKYSVNIYEFKTKFPHRVE
ncbi:MAG: 4-phosphopantetheinyl transferase [Cycloclasticus sp.]|nr:MAG: 4-phosphopantetheinyl transferase [Cycloclasticus sp.]